MNHKTCQQIYQWFQPVSIKQQIIDNCQLTGKITQNAQTCCQGDIFIARQGQKFDGHRYVQQAIAQGAIMVIAQRHEPILHDNHTVSYLVVPDLTQYLADFAAWFYDYPGQKMTVVGVTGTNGKTSVVSFLAQLLSGCGQTVGVLGTAGNGIFPELQPASHTTLDAVALQTQLAYFKQHQVTVVCAEVSSHAIAQDRIRHIVFHTSIFTNLDADHLDYHQTLEAYFQTKAKLMTTAYTQQAIINQDSSYGQRLIAQLQQQQQTIITYSLTDPSASIYLSIQTHHTEGIVVAIWVNGICWHSNCLIPVWGDFNISNIAAGLAALIGQTHDCSKQTIIDQLETLQPPVGRVNRYRAPGKPLVIIDFAHTTEALELLLQVVRNQVGPSAWIWCIFGCGGDRDPGKRPSMAQVALTHADTFIITEDNNRFEPFDQIIQDMKAVLSEADKPYYIQPDRYLAIEQAIEQAQPDDVIVLAGKGHEQYIDRQGVKHFFSEHQILIDQGYQRD